MSVLFHLVWRFEMLMVHILTYRMISRCRFYSPPKYAIKLSWQHRHYLNSFLPVSSPTRHIVQNAEVYQEKVTFADLHVRADLHILCSTDHSFHCPSVKPAPGVRVRMWKFSLTCVPSRSMRFWVPRLESVRQSTARRLSCSRKPWWDGFYTTNTLSTLRLRFWKPAPALYSNPPI